MPPGKASGVIVRDAHLQIDLRAKGFGRERLDLQPTPANIKYAERLRQEILGKIERGTFALVDYFPDSPRVSQDVKSLTWRALWEEWVKVKKGDIEHSTLVAYQQTLSSYHFKEWQRKHLVALDFRALKIILAALPANPKTFNNIASVLGMVLEYGYKAKLLREPLHEEIAMRSPPKPEPDPFDLAEIEVLLSKMRGDKARNYYEFAIFTGLRPSEQIALRWEHVDLRRGILTVRVAHTRGKEKGPKNGIVREVELTGRARAVLERQRAISQMAGDHVFLSLDHEPYTTTDGPLDAWWRPAMVLSKIRYRDARQTRHTFATICLHAGLKPAWAASQLGHSVEMFYRVYAKWIKGADHGAERRKLDEFLSPKTGTQTGT